MLKIHEWNPGIPVLKVIGNDSIMIASINRFIRSQCTFMNGIILECNLMNNREKLSFLTNQCLYYKILIQCPENYLEYIFTIESIAYIYCLDKYKILPFKKEVFTNSRASLKLQFFQRKGKIPQKYLNIMAHNL